MYLVSHFERNDWRGRVLTDRDMTEDEELFWMAYLEGGNWVLNPT
jgi:hypothetical protein